MTKERLAMLRETLESAFQPMHLHLEDDSDQHIGHQSAGGGGHFSVVVVSDHFLGLSRIARHRLIYKALSKALEKEVHALSIKAFTPDEYV